MINLFKVPSTWRMSWPCRILVTKYLRF